jgi:hypothetical protein
MRHIKFLGNFLLLVSIGIAPVIANAFGSGSSTLRPSNTRVFESKNTAPTSATTSADNEVWTSAKNPACTPANSTNCTTNTCVDVCIASRTSTVVIPDTPAAGATLPVGAIKGAICPGGYQKIAEFNTGPEYSYKAYDEIYSVPTLADYNAKIAEGYKWLSPTQYWGDVYTPTCEDLSQSKAIACLQDDCSPGYVFELNGTLKVVTRLEGSITTSKSFIVYKASCKVKILGVDMYRQPGLIFTGKYIPTKMACSRLKKE